MQTKEEVMREFFTTKPDNAEHLKQYKRDMLVLNTLLEVRDLLAKK